jgi:hypothetical protein
MVKTRRNKYGKNNKTSKKNRKTLRRKGTRKGKKGGFLSTTGFGIGNFGYSKTEGARRYNPTTGQWDYQDCYAFGPFKGCKNRAP